MKLTDKRDSMPVISDNLMHFLGRVYKDSPSKQLDIFKSIITEGLKCSSIQVKFGNAGNVFNQVVCFTDIPLSFCDEHTAIYGKFGIGFKKSYLKRCGGNPVRYFVDYLPGESSDIKLTENRGSLSLNISKHFKIIHDLKKYLDADTTFCLYDKNGNVLVKHMELQEWLSEQLVIFSYEKEMGDLGPARDETKEVDLYYKEREWRLVLTNLNLKSGIVEQKRSEYYYKFGRNDINLIVTPNDEIRTDVLKYLLSFSENKDPRLKEFAENPLTIISYDDLNKW